MWLGTAYHLRYLTYVNNRTPSNVPPSDCLNGYCGKLVLLLGNKEFACRLSPGIVMAASVSAPAGPVGTFPAPFRGSLCPGSQSARVSLKFSDPA